MAEPAGDHEDEYMEGDEVDEEDVAAPGGHHVEVGDAAEAGPVDVARLDALDPEVVGEEHAEDGDGLVIVAASDTPGDVAGDDGDHPGGAEAGAGGVELAVKGEKIDILVSHFFSRPGRSQGLLYKQPRNSLIQ